MGIRSAVASHRALAGLGALVVVGVIVFVLAYFEPQKLVIDDRVAEPVPSLESGEGPGAGSAGDAGGKGREPAIETLSSGDFQSYEHSTTGRARVIRLTAGSRFLRFQRFETSNGPDLRVYLSAAQARGPGEVFDDDYVELGELKGNIGDQNYPIPANVELRRFPSAVVWCKRFSVAFGAAPVQ
jgi:hypothetical protein